MSGQARQECTGDAAVDELAREEAELRNVLAEREREREQERRAQARLVEIQRLRAERKRQTAIVKATERIKGISRAAGSVAASYAADQQRFEEAVNALDKVRREMNDRYEQLKLCSAESSALMDCLGVTGAKLPDVLPPDAVEAVVEGMRRIREMTFVEKRSIEPIEERCEHGLRARRNYAEIAGTAGYEIIMEAGGPKSFAPLSETQQRIVEDRQREREQGTRTSREISQLAKETTAAYALVPGGGIR
jgi:hypothetical protein